MTRTRRDVVAPISLCLLLSACVVQFSTSVDLVRDRDAWLLYVDEPTSHFEFSPHAVAFGNVPNRYRISIPRPTARIEASELEAYARDERGYSKRLDVSGGFIAIDNCRVRIELRSGTSSISFNGAYKLPTWSCKVQGSGT